MRRTYSRRSGTRQATARAAPQTAQNHRNDAFPDKTRPRLCTISKLLMARFDGSSPARHRAIAAPGRELSRPSAGLFRRLMRLRPAAAIAAAVLAALLLADARHIAAAQGRLEAEYSATL